MKSNEFLDKYSRLNNYYSYVNTSGYIVRKQTVFPFEQHPVIYNYQSDIENNSLQTFISKDYIKIIKSFNTVCSLLCALEELSDFNFKVNIIYDIIAIIAGIYIFKKSFNKN